MGKPWVVASLALLLAAGLAAPGPASPRREEKLPNLFAWPLSLLLGPETGQIRGYNGAGVDPVVMDGCLTEEKAAGAQRCLRFSTVLGNLDLGSLDLALRVEPSGRNVYQITDGGRRCTPAGTFTFDPVRREVQLEDFYVVRLWEFDGVRRVGPPVASTGLRDMCPVSTVLGRVEPGCRGRLRSGPQGPETVLSLPWLNGVWYLPDEPGQFIEISGVPDGRYVLEIEIDPLDHFAESYEPDNSTCVVIVLRGTKVYGLQHDYCWPERTPVGDRNRDRSA